LFILLPFLGAFFLVIRQAEWHQLSAWSANVSNGVLVLAVAAIVLTGMLRRIPVYDCFVAGAGKGFSMAIDLIPYLVGMWVAIALLRASGAFSFLAQALNWLNQQAGYRLDWLAAVPQCVVKMFSASASRAMMLDVFKAHGPDSPAGYLASIVQSASDTTFYVLTACAGATRLRDLGHAVVGALVVAITAFVLAVCLCSCLYS
jgi:spore maturation protein SpmB